MDSILVYIKKLLGYSEDDRSFDDEIMNFINMAFGRLNQLGVGSTEIFIITGTSEKWTDFIGTNKWMEPSKTYIYLKTKIVHDPPLSSIVLESMKSAIDELECDLRDTAERERNKNIT
mgnify:CR=1 FL=1